ncbi:putative 3-hydroxyacyl-CoA dehydrogenase [Usitatibacter rugosus]|uniref:Putative 3-hydroxyacyl-CoA dehydrogenase n=2 Tax=Usitatibacter rugosus TaxID=2732067 RepID=A0A6M4GRG6_9PROT|nr:3-hydroxyacyl-CoA dehydrogenase/enoyl-CoA hydratase family protein [Usitatibacter rugosus]QJR09712.1 putative 3-hydroxyacyl-CoA dehydrogenase [Usitatibacter rugosus]
MPEGTTVNAAVGQRYLVRKAAVLGAGVMGAQIAAHLANANVQPILFELAAEGKDKNANVKKAIDGLAKLEPSPLATKAALAQIIPANYDEHLGLLAECDLVIEAISERMDWKKALFEKVAPHIAPGAIFASNTSGLSITEMSKTLPAALRKRFCGIHFFNPPRYMRLVELVPTPDTDPAILDQLETFLTTTLGKGVIRAKDTPNFIANRVGVFSMLAAMHHTQRLNLGFDEVDALTGPAIGRAKSATYRTADVVGLDTMAHVVKTMGDTLPADPWAAFYRAPEWLAQLIAKGALGQKTKAGVYTKKGKDILVLDVGKKDYRASAGTMAEEVQAILKDKNPGDQLAKLRASSNPQAQFLWAIFRDLFHYSAVHLAEIAGSARDVDLAIRWGFGWSRGPFELWQAAGWKRVAEWITEDIAAGKAMASVALPKWVSERDGVHTPEGSYSAETGKLVPRPALPVYARQLFPETVLGEKQADRGTTVFEDDGVRMWHQGDRIAIVSFKSKMHSLGEEVLKGLNRAIDEAEKNFDALVIWHEAPFAVGANLKSALEALKAGKLEDFEKMVALFQQTSQRLKYSLVPTVAAVEGMALGGGAEFVMHSQRVVAALESYVGLVEVGVGLLPAGGGLKEFAGRAQAWAKGGDATAEIQRVFKMVAMAEVSKSAENAREMGFLKPSDVVVFHPAELLHVAKAEARAMAASGVRPPLAPAQVAVLGDTGAATLKMLLVNMKEGGFISDHDYDISSRIAEILTGGPIEPGSLVDEKWLLDLERRHFVELGGTEKTQQRIEHMLKTGKPLRN